jgi:hypothetical protein
MAQSILSGADPVSSGSCSALTLESAASLTLKQRMCFYGSQLIAPQFAVESALAAGYNQIRNSPLMRHQKPDIFAYRMATNYLRYSARDVGELIAGSWHHEEVRPHHSSAHGFLPRTRAAMASVVNSPGEDGESRLALAPVAGSFGSALTFTAMYQRHQDVESFFTHAGVAYGHYFVRAFFAEFKPELKGCAQRWLRWSSKAD